MLHDLSIDLDIKDNLLVTVTCKQLDSINLTATIYDNSVPADLTNYKCRLKALKSDNKPLIQNTDITINNNIVKIKCNEQLTVVSNLVKAELEFINTETGEKKHSFNINFKIVSSVLEVEDTVSKSTITLLEELDSKLDQVENIGDVLDEAIRANESLEGNISTGNTLSSTLEVNISDATNINNELSNNNSLATSNNTELKNTILDANSTKTALDTANTQATKNIEAMQQFGDVSQLSQTVTSIKTKTDKFTEDDNGDLLYNGEKISADSTADAVTTTPISGLISSDSNVQNCLELLNSKFLSLKSYTGNKTYYVDETNGDDTNDGLTTDTPFKTIGKAWKMIPTFFNSVYTIKIIGDYSNSVFFDAKIATGFSNRIIIMSNDESNISTITRDWYFVNVQSVGYGTSTIYAGLYLGSLKFVGAGIQFYGCKEGYVDNCIFDGTTSMTNFVYVYNSNVTVSKNTFTGKTSSGLSLIYATRHSSLYSYSNTYNTSKIATACYVNSNITSNSDTFTSITTNNTKDGSSNFTKN